MAKKVELNYQVNIHEGVNNLEKSVQQIDQSLKNLKFSNEKTKISIHLPKFRQNSGFRL